jgi:hypothetical protein
MRFCVERNLLTGEDGKIVAGGLLSVICEAVAWPDGSLRQLTTYDRQRSQVEAPGTLKREEK